MRCIDCRTWAQKDLGEGECRAEPPHKISMVVAYDGETNSYIQRGIWPQTHADDWCGKFFAKIFPPA